MRAFLAIDVDSEVRERVTELVRELRPVLDRGRFVSKENLHLTLRFLGETTKDKVDAIASRLSQSTAAVSELVIGFRGLGVFPNPRRARVLWVGTTAPPNELFALQSTIEKEARKLGFEPEPGAFHPHLTVARFRHPPTDVATLLKAAETRDFGLTTVKAVVLHESVTSADGASYRVLATFPLSGSS